MRTRFVRLPLAAALVAASLTTPLAQNKPASTADIPRVPFEQYLARAETRAIADPAFREQYESAKRQYTALGGKING